MVDVLHVEFHPFFEGDIASAVHLPKAGDSRADTEPASLPGLVKAIVVS